MLNNASKQPLSPFLEKPQQQL
jgi:hypothetical protein